MAKAGDHDKPTAEPAIEMLNIYQVARILKLPTARVRTLRERGELDGEAQPDGSLLFNREEVETFSDGRELTERDLVGQSIALTRTAHDQVNKLAELAQKPVRDIVIVLQKENDSLRERNAILEGRVDLMIEAVDKARTKEHERWIERYEIERGDRLQERAFATIEKALPFVAPQLKAIIDQATNQKGSTPGLGNGQKTIEELDCECALIIANIPDQTFALIEASGYFSDADLETMRDTREKVNAYRQKLSAKSENSAPHEATANVPKASRTKKAASQ
jgi:hypothetical protein